MQKKFTVLNFRDFSWKGLLSAGIVLAVFASCTEDTVAPAVIQDVDQKVEKLTLWKPQSGPVNLLVKYDDDSAPMVNDRRATTAGGPDRGRFNITLKFLTPVTERQFQVFDEAAGRWEGIIIGDVPSITGTLPSAFEGLPPVANNETIDDIIIEVALIPIDGPGGTLGAAGPVFVRNVDNLPVTGVMFFDTDDLAFLDLFDLFEEVIVHEMGHVLGIGTLWNVPGARELRKFNPEGFPYFDGKMANTFWNSEGGLNFLPIEDEFGPGTQLSHWDEEILGNELMTGFLNLGPNPLSRITAGSVRDLGYTSASRGERYDLPRGTPGITARTSGEGINIAEGEILLAPIGVVSNEQ
ncbi:leishmanolysin-related zinc metalloendopeptidase [Algoriphagus confluentis]|uniref:Leishmanolysin n=1 Tax=Algoriphagus confluentis TaxID=1697556 RepID=A0ABQ6PSV7_9BACT|nr:hypothetical protein Aconfl_37220 [Algoriphagus confluentis]